MEKLAFYIKEMILSSDYIRMPFVPMLRAWEFLLI